MPASVIASGTQACTVGTRHVLASGTGPAGGAVFALALDVAALTPGQWLDVELLRPALVGGTLRAWGGGPFAMQHGGGFADAPILRVPSGMAYEVAITQRGAAGGRSIPWSLERIDG